MNITVFSGVLEVQLLETANLYEDSLEEEFVDDSSVFLFANVQLTQQVRRGRGRVGRGGWGYIV